MHSPWPSLLDDTDCWALLSSPDLTAFQRPLAGPIMQPGQPSTSEGGTPQANVEATYALEGATGGNTQQGALDSMTLLDFDAFDFSCSSPKRLPDQTLDLPMEESPSFHVNDMPASESPQPSYSPALSDGTEGIMINFQGASWTQTTETPVSGGSNYSPHTITSTMSDAKEGDYQQYFGDLPTTSTGGLGHPVGSWVHRTRPTATTMTDEDLALAEATLKAEATGSETPKVKEELAYRIQSRRRQQGMQPVVVKPEPEKPEVLTQADEIRRSRRRASNRKAATKLRSRKKQEERDLKESHERLERENASLREEIRRLSTENLQYEETLQSHTDDPNCALKRRKSDD